MGQTVVSELPSVSGFAARCALAALDARGVAVEPLLRRAGLSRKGFATPSHRISAAAQAKFLELAAEATGDTAFGLHLGQEANPRAAGLLYYAASSAANIGEGLALIARYARIVNEAIRLRPVRGEEGVVVEVVAVGVARHSFRQNSEFAMAVLLAAIRDISGRVVRPVHTAFAHTRESNRDAFDRFFGCRVEFVNDGGAAPRCDSLVFSHDTLLIPLQTGDPYLLETLRPFCEDAAKKRQTRPGSLRSEVETEVQKLLPHGKAQASAVAKALHLSVRTLSRRLAREDTTFADIVDQVRRSLALRYLKEPGFSMSHIAWLLGYEQASSFNHAFQRWTGRSPSESRKPRSAGSPEAASAKPRAPEALVAAATPSGGAKGLNR